MILNEETIQTIILERKQSNKAEMLIKEIFNKDMVEKLYQVANLFNDEERYTVSLLRKILNNNNITFNELIKLGFKESYLSSIQLISQKDTEEECYDLILASDNTVVMDIIIIEINNILKKAENSDDKKMVSKYQIIYDKIKSRRDKLK